MKNIFKTVVAAVILLSINSCRKENADHLLADSKSFSETSRVFTIGKHYGGGIIFYIDGSGKHGLIAAAHDESAQIKWYAGSYINTGATATFIGAGAANTQSIINAQGVKKNYAAIKCTEFAGGNFSDWYLPSKDELYEIYRQRALLGSPGGIYWSSSESITTALSANDLDFFDGSWHENFKSTKHSIRAVRSF